MSKKAGTTARDLELLVLAWQSLKTSPQIDYDLFARKAGYKNAATACAQFSTLKRKVFALAASSDGSTTPTSTPTGTPRKRRAATSKTTTPSSAATAKKNKKLTDFYPTNADADHDVGDDASPSKKVKMEATTLRAGAPAVKQERRGGGDIRDPFKLLKEEDGDDDDKAIGLQLDGYYAHGSYDSDEDYDNEA